MLRYGYCMPSGSFMSPGIGTVESALDILMCGYRAVMDIGYDFAECTVGILMKLSDCEYKEACDLVKFGKMKIERCNSFIPGDMKITGENVDTFVITEYIKKAMMRVSGIGANVVVFGSGMARRVPENFDRDIAKKQIYNFLKICNDIGDEYGITTAIEPLNFRECNIFNTAEECFNAAEEISLPYIKVLADSFHMSEVGESTEILPKIKKKLVHTHIAEAVCRKYPGINGGEYVTEFLSQLKQCGYNGTVTVECGSNDFISDCKKAYHFLKSFK